MRDWKSLYFVPGGKKRHLISAFLLIIATLIIESHYSLKLSLTQNSSPINLLGMYTIVLIVSICISISFYPNQSIRTTISGDYQDIGSYVLIVNGIRTITKSLIEELIFRVTPFIIMTLIISQYTSQIALVIYYTIACATTIAWIEMHADRRLIVAPFGILLGYLLISGLIIEAIIIHVLHNLLMYSTVILDITVLKHRSV